MDYITPVIQHWIDYVFGDMLIAGVVFMFFLFLWGLKRNWSIDMYIVVFVPIIAILSTAPAGSIFGNSLLGPMFVLIGVAIALGLMRLLR